MTRFINLGFVFLCFMIDAILQTIFPVDFEMRRLFFVSSCGVVGLMLVVQDMKFNAAWILAFTVGLILDLSHYGYFLLNAFVLMITIIALRYWSNQVNSSLLEFMTLSIVAIFTKEFLIFIVMRMSGLSSISFLNWFIYREFLTLIGHIPLVLGIRKIYRLKEILLNDREQLKRKAEDPLFMNLGRRS